MIKKFLFLFLLSFFNLTLVKNIKLKNCKSFLKNLIILNISILNTIFNKEILYFMDSNKNNNIFKLFLLLPFKNKNINFYKLILKIPEFTIDIDFSKNKINLYYSIIKNLNDKENFNNEKFCLAIDDFISLLKKNDNIDNHNILSKFYAEGKLLENEKLYLSKDQKIIELLRFLKIYIFKKNPLDIQNLFLKELLEESKKENFYEYLLYINKKKEFIKNNFISLFFSTFISLILKKKDINFSSNFIVFSFFFLLLKETLMNNKKKYILDLIKNKTDSKIKNLSEKENNNFDESYFLKNLPSNLFELFNNKKEININNKSELIKLIQKNDEPNYLINFFEIQENFFNFIKPSQEEKEKTEETKNYSFSKSIKILLEKRIKNINLYNNFINTIYFINYSTENLKKIMKKKLKIIKEDPSTNEYSQITQEYFDLLNIYKYIFYLKDNLIKNYYS